VYLSRYNRHAGTCSYLIQPNQSLSWSQTLRFFYVSLFISLLIAVGFLLMGAWLILPFTGLEMLLLFAGLYWVSWRCCECEVLSIKEESIEIERFRGQQSKALIVLPRQWTRIEFQKRDDVWYSTKLQFCFRQQCVEVASHLTDEEKKRLVAEIRQVL
jgi:uncharacterized membrane protein